MTGKTTDEIQKLVECVDYLGKMLEDKLTKIEDALTELTELKRKQLKIIRWWKR